MEKAVPAAVRAAVPVVAVPAAEEVPAEAVVPAAVRLLVQAAVAVPVVVLRQVPAAEGRRAEGG